MERTGRLDTSHPLAPVARKHCQSKSHQRRHRIGDVACGECWELAIRDDERVVVEFDLPREITVDGDYVDDIAVELACRGHDVRLSRADRSVAAMRLAHRGVSVTEIARRLHLTSENIRLLIDAPTRFPSTAAELMPVAA